MNEELNKELEKQNDQSMERGGVETPEEPPYSNNEAVKGIQEKLSQNTGPFTWDGFSANSQDLSEHRDLTHKVWYLKIPEKDQQGEVQIVHMCRPARMWAAMLRGEKDALIPHNGFVLKDFCQRCRRQVPAKLFKLLVTIRNALTVEKVL